MGFFNDLFTCMRGGVHVFPKCLLVYRVTQWHLQAPYLICWCVEQLMCYSLIYQIHQCLLPETSDTLLKPAQHWLGRHLPLSSGRYSLTMISSISCSSSPSNVVGTCNLFYHLGALLTLSFAGWFCLILNICKLLHFTHHTACMFLVELTLYWGH